MANFVIHNLVADYLGGKLNFQNKKLYRVGDATSDNLTPFPSLEPGAGFRRTITVNYLY